MREKWQERTTVSMEWILKAVEHLNNLSNHIGKNPNKINLTQGKNKHSSEKHSELYFKEEGSGSNSLRTWQNKHSKILTIQWIEIGYLAFKIVEEKVE